GSADLALANLHRVRQEHEQAIEHYQRAADSLPSNPTPLVRAARMALSLDREVLAAGFLDRLLETHPRLAVAHALYGNVLVRRGDRLGAKDHYQQALTGEGPKNPAWLHAAIRRMDAPVRRESE